MKNNALVTILLGLLLVSAFASLICFWGWQSNERERRNFMNAMNEINFRRNLISAVANDAMEYSKRHPEIDPILVSVGLKPGSNTPAPTTTKPTTK